MLRITYPDGTVAEADGEQSEKRLLEAASSNRAYSVETLAQRLDISIRSAYDLIRNGNIRYVCAGKKNYRISELAVREFLGDVSPLPT